MLYGYYGCAESPEQQMVSKNVRSLLRLKPWNSVVYSLKVLFGILSCLLLVELFAFFVHLLYYHAHEVSVHYVTGIRRKVQGKWIVYVSCKNETACTGSGFGMRHLSLVLPAELANAMLHSIMVPLG